MNAEFERLLAECDGALRRLVGFTVASPHDAQDVLQETRLCAWENFASLRDRARFRPWLMSIARRRCADYLRKKARAPAAMPVFRAASVETRAAREALSRLPDGQRALIEAKWLRGEREAELAARLNVPEGTVKSRMYAARGRFRQMYEQIMREEGRSMDVFPNQMPAVTLVRGEGKPFEVICEQDMGSFLVPRLGERARYATYDYDPYPRMRLTGETTGEVLGQARVHGLSCVQMRTVEKNEGETREERLFERIHEGRIQTLAALDLGAEAALHTFLDDDFLPLWGFGAENCGEDTLRRRRGAIEVGEDGALTAQSLPESDVLDRWNLRIGGAEAEVIRFAYCSDDGMLVEQFIGRDGRALLFRRYNRDDWQIASRGERWTQRLPDAPRLTVNGDAYVHWYDCLPDYAIPPCNSRIASSRERSR